MHWPGNVRQGVLVAGISFCIAACQSGPSEPFTESDLNFSATMVWKADAKFVDSPEGKSCVGIEVEELKLEDINIPLASHTVSTECRINTKDYGVIQYTGGSIGGNNFMVTASQAERFRKLVQEKK